MASQYCGSKEKLRKMASVRGFHGFKQGLSERSLSYALDRPTSRCYYRPSSDELFRCLSRISSNIASTKGPGKDSFLDALRLEKCKIHLSKDDD